MVIGQTTAGQPGVAEKSCSQNVNDWERWGSTIAGAGMTLGGILRGKAPGLVLTLVGGGLLYRGLTGHCGMYQMLGINTRARSNPAIGVPARQGVRIEESVVVKKTPEEIYRFWHRLENLPRFMRHLESVMPLEQGRSRWIARGPFGTRLEWEAEIVNEREGELIAWRSLPGGDVDTAGSVHFRLAPNDQGTAIQINLKYDPPGGKVAAHLASFLGQGLEQQLREDLMRLKQSIESGELPTSSEYVTSARP